VVQVCVGKLCKRCGAAGLVTVRQRLRQGTERYRVLKPNLFSAFTPHFAPLPQWVLSQNSVVAPRLVRVPRSQNGLSHIWVPAFSGTTKVQSATIGATSPQWEKKSCSPSPSMGCPKNRRRTGESRCPGPLAISGFRLSPEGRRRTPLSTRRSPDRSARPYNQAKNG